MSNNGTPTKVNLLDCESFICPECSESTFKTVFTLKKISVLMSQSGKEELINLETFVCSVCGFNTGIIKRN